MDKEAERQLFRKHAEVLHVLANPLRHEVVHRLIEGPRTVTQLTQECDASKSNISQHLALLRAHGLVESRREGRQVYFSLTYPELGQACALIDQVLLDQARRGLRLQGPAGEASEG